MDRSTHRRRTVSDVSASMTHATLHAFLLPSSVPPAGAPSTATCLTPSAARRKARTCTRPSWTSRDAPSRRWRRNERRSTQRQAREHRVDRWEEILAVPPAHRPSLPYCCCISSFLLSPALPRRLRASSSPTRVTRVSQAAYSRARRRRTPTAAREKRA